MPASSLLTLLEIWQAKLRAWAAEGAMSKAARSALSLEGTQHLKRKTQLSVGPNTKKLSLDFKYRIKAELSSMSASYSAEHFLNCLGIYKNGD